VRLARPLRPRSAVELGRSASATQRSLRLFAGLTNPNAGVTESLRALQRQVAGAPHSVALAPDLRELCPANGEDPDRFAFRSDRRTPGLARLPLCGGLLEPWGR